MRPIVIFLAKASYVFVDFYLSLQRDQLAIGIASNARIIEQMKNCNVTTKLFQSNWETRIACDEILGI